VRLNAGVLLTDPAAAEYEQKKQEALKSGRIGEASGHRATSMSAERVNLQKYCVLSTAAAEIGLGKITVRERGGRHRLEQLVSPQ
jgi:hypothetical protein